MPNTTNELLVPISELFGSSNDIRNSLRLIEGQCDELSHWSIVNAISINWAAYKFVEIQVILICVVETAQVK